MRTHRVQNEYAPNWDLLITPTNAYKKWVHKRNKNEYNQNNNRDWKFHIFSITRVKKENKLGTKQEQITSTFTNKCLHNEYVFFFNFFFIIQMREKREKKEYNPKLSTNLVKFGLFCYVILFHSNLIFFKF